MLARAKRILLDGLLRDTKDSLPCPPSDVFVNHSLHDILLSRWINRIGVEKGTREARKLRKKESSSKFSGISLQDTNFLEEMTPFLTNYRCLDTVFRLNYVIFLFLQNRLQRKEKGRNNSIVSLQIFISRISFESIHGKWERKKFQSTPVSSTISNPHLKSPLSPFTSLRRFFT